MPSRAEQAAAAAIGLMTAGPLGATSAWWMLRLLRGKWTPWALLGVFLAPATLVLQIGILTAITAAPEAQAPVTERAQ